MDILYTDAHVVVAVKPRGILSEEKDGEESMPAFLAAHVGPVYPVHRLDRAVGGVMVYARSKRAAAALSAAIQAGTLQKEYTAILSGVPQAPEGEWRDLLYHDVRQNKTFVVDRVKKGAREAILTYRLLEQRTVEGADFSRVCIQLLTGRSHQIRVQFASRRLPLVGDGKYGSRQKAPYIALAATKLTFPHPVSGKLLTFSAPTPTDFPWNLFSDSHYEIERKFLIAYPDIAQLTAMEGCCIKHLTQTYLTAPEGETDRVREVREGESVTYIRTVKRRVTPLRAVEEETLLTPEEYGALLERADSTRTPVKKTRYCIPLGNHIVEIDVYDFWQDRAVLEVELSDEEEPFEIPTGVRVLREVTADFRYKNVSLARCVPEDPLT